MSALLSFSRVVDSVTTFFGRAVSWLVLVVVLVSAGNAVIRKTFDISSNAWLELQWYLFGAIFMLAAAWTLLRNEHIRVDIVSNAMRKRTRDWIDLVGHLVMLIPFTLLMIWLLVPYVVGSFERWEFSPNAGGLLLWPAKALLLAGFVLLFFQGVSEVIKRASVLFGGRAEPSPTPAGHAEAGELAATAPDTPQGGADAPAAEDADSSREERQG